MSENPSNLPVPVQAIPMEKPLSPLDIALADTEPLYLSTMPNNDIAGKQLMYRALNGEHLPFKSVLNTPIKLVGFVIRPSDEQVSKEGEIYRYPIAVLVTDDEKLIRAGSRGVATCLRQLQSMYGNGPWNPPIEVIPRARDIGNGQSWGYLEMPIQPKQEKGKK